MRTAASSPADEVAMQIAEREWQNPPLRVRTDGARRKAIARCRKPGPNPIPLNERERKQ